MENYSLYLGSALLISGFILGIQWMMTALELRRVKQTIAKQGL